MKQEIFISFFDIKKNGIFLNKTEKANSLVVGYNDFIYAWVTGNSLTSAKDTSNTAQSIATGNATDINAAAANSLYGIVVGTTGTAVAISDFKLASLITHGSTAGQLQYGATTIIAPVTVSSYSSWFISRSFLNNSGSDIVIAETGIYLKYTSGTKYFLIERNVPSPYTVSNTMGCIVQYEFRNTV
jgi:hypothetical protein